MMMMMSMGCDYVSELCQIIYEHGEPWWMMSTEEKFQFIHQSSIWQSYQESHLVGNREDLGEESDGFCLRNISFIFVKSCRKILLHGAFGFTSSPKEGMLLIFMALKIYPLCQV
jgi:hypothetical protein